MTDLGNQKLRPHENIFIAKILLFFFNYKNKIVFFKLILKCLIGIYAGINITEIELIIF